MNMVDPKGDCANQSLELLYLTIDYIDLVKNCLLEKPDGHSSCRFVLSECSLDVKAILHIT